MRLLFKRVAITAGVLVGVLLLVVAGSAVWLRSELRASLPIIDGELALVGLSGPVTVERDELGVPTIRGTSRDDVARATGFVHAQDRFFQMDLLRRGAAGELAALFGPALVDHDRSVRLHRLRARAAQALARERADTLRLLEAYTDGVNAGLAALGSVPPEYLVARVEPEPWTTEDTLLVVFAMYLDLQDERGRHESAIGVMAEVLPSELLAFLVPMGTDWDAPLVGEPLPVPDVPPPSIYDLRGLVNEPAAAARRGARPRAGSEDATELHAGSNSWAVSAAHTRDGAALVANDMHLGLQLPNIWYRVCFVWPEGDRERRVAGVTLPGTPVVVAGSNGQVAWGFTNSELDFTDLVLLETDPADETVYRTAEGPRRFDRFEERIEVQGQQDVTLEVRETIWGPVVDRDHHDRQRAVRWVAHLPGAVDMGLMGLERVANVDDALDVAARVGIPTQNLVAADHTGRIGWTLIGPLPRRHGLEGERPTYWTDPARGWDGWIAAAERPSVIDPPTGRVWTANNRVAGADAARRLGSGQTALGARARQIRDALLERESVTVADMLGVQLDDRALLLERWRQLLLELLDEDALVADPRRVELERLVREDWNGRAATGSAGYRMVRAFRLFLAEQVFDAITAACREADDGFRFMRTTQWEGPLWRLVTERPVHLLDPRLESWDDQLLAAVDEVLDYFGELDDRTLARQTWGRRNTVRIRHPMSQVLPGMLADRIDASAAELPGDTYMPRVQGPTFGASERFVVAPGREEEGLFHMPGGQSGHPLSPFYLAGHDAWVTGQPTPFLPGPARHTLTLRPD